MFMRTERLFLRPLFPEDWREVYRGLADYGVVSMLARAPWPYRPVDAQAYCRKPAQKGALQFSVTLPELAGAPLIGQIGVGPFGENSYELGYWIGQKWQRRGYATEAARGVLAVADALGIERIEAGHYLENPASGKVLRAAGFAETGEVRPVACAARGGELVLSRRYERCNSAMVERSSEEAA